MPPDFAYSETLARSLVDRAGSLGQYIRSLQASHSGSADAYNAALDLFDVYTQNVILHAQLDMEVKTPSGRADIFEQRLVDFFKKEELFDQRFARGGQNKVPRSLHTLARRELRALGLDEYEAVLTVGPPDSFETDGHDLATYLFDSFRPGAVPSRTSAPRLAVVSVPYLEGTRALWFPICLGHELAHVRIEHVRGGPLQIPDFAEDVDEADHDLAVILDQVEGHADGAGLGRVEKMRTTLRSWTEELACDLNSVRTFGPAGLCSIAEFLSTLQVTVSQDRRWSPQQASRSHPALTTRVAFMLRMLERIGFRRDASYLTAWETHADHTAGQPTRAMTYLTDVISKRQEVLIDHVLNWGDLGFAPPRRVVISNVANKLLAGIPGLTHCQDHEGNSVEVTVADVVNASWAAREKLGSADLEPPSLSTNDYQNRVTLDTLASKAIDDLEFCRLWRAAGRGVIDTSSLEAPHVELRGGVLSWNAIVTRLCAADGPERLTVTPLLDNALQDSGVDLRLGADFIVLRHSATSVFDSVTLDRSLGHSQDPRKVQENVTKSWGEPFILHPGELVLASTFEYIVLPDDVAAQVVTRSSYGRLGLITATAVQVQPGSRNCITLELVNHGATPISLMPGTRIAQLVMMHVPDPVKPRPGKYWHPVGPEFSKVGIDPDAEDIRTVARIVQRTVDSGFGSPGLSYGKIVTFRFIGNMDDAYDVYSVMVAEDLKPSFRSHSSDVERAEKTFRYSTVGQTSIPGFIELLAKLIRRTRHGIAVVVQKGELVLEETEGLAQYLCRVDLDNGSVELDFGRDESKGILQRHLMRWLNEGDGRWVQRQDG